MPAHHNLEAYLDAYLDAARIGEAKKSPLFRSARGRTGQLTESAMNRVGVAHESPRTTKLYDRTGYEITLDEVERVI